MRSCTGCGRPLGKVARRCIYCGAPAEGVELAPEASHRKPVVIQCPGCVRKNRLPPDVIASCTYCALSLIIDDAGNVRLGPAPGTAPASHAEVDAAVADLPPARLWDLITRVLVARARLGDLGEGEAERAIRCLEAVATWPTDRTWWLPIALADAATILPRCVFGHSDGSLVPDAAERYVRIALGTKPRASLKADWLAREAIGLALSSAIGVGMRPEETTENAARLWLVVFVEPRDHGVELIDMGFQVDEGAHRPADANVRADVVARVAASRELLASYYILGALFGPSCRGGTVFGLTRDGIAQRLEALGCNAPADLVDRLHVRMPAPVGWPA